MRTSATPPVNMLMPTRRPLSAQEVELGIEFRMPLPTLATAVQALLEGFALGSAIDDDVDTAALTAALEMLLRPAAPPS